MAVLAITVIGVLSEVYRPVARKEAVDNLPIVLDGVICFLDPAFTPPALAAMTCVISKAGEPAPHVTSQLYLTPGTGLVLLPMQLVTCFKLFVRAIRCVDRHIKKSIRD